MDFKSDSFIFGNTSQLAYEYEGFPTTQAFLIIIGYYYHSIFSLHPSTQNNDPGIKVTVSKVKFPCRFVMREMTGTSVFGSRNILPFSGTLYGC